ncbi:hypothetical protein SADUNF_Sadunf10G0183200 [Salix dunnii]|uniref:XS domain-containing protein n=1 Tax=Salix dunnii TaxID=1413687 RepID=A0A835JTT7_9ROSI|nr:hypothetical protein SADUNF_Sadunf10G0183200 [Salix dunnii]
MQPRKRGEYTARSPSAKTRNQHRTEVRHESHPAPRRNAVDRSPRVHRRRSLSPRSKVEGTRKVVHGEGRSSSTERRDSSWHLGAGRTEKVGSGSPQYVQERKKPHFDEGVVHRKYKQVEEFGDGKSKRLKRGYGYDHPAASSRVSKEKDYRDNRVMGISVPMEDGMIRGSFRGPRDLVPNSNYRDTGSHMQSMSRDMDIGHFEDEERQFRETIPSDKIPVRRFYEDGEKPMLHSRYVPYTRMSESAPRFKDFAGSSSGFSRGEFPGSYREGMPLAASDEYPRGSVKLTELTDFNTYRERSIMDIRDHEAGKRIMASYPQDAYNPKRASHDHYLYSKSQGIVDDNHAYPSDDIHRMMSPPSPLNYEHAQTDFEHRDFSRMSMHPVRDSTDHTDGSCINMRRSTVFDHPTLQKPAPMENLDTSRIQNTSKHNVEYLGSAYTRVDFGQGELQDNRRSHSGVTQDHQVPHSRPNYGFGRDAGPQFQKEILHDPPMPIYDMEMQRLAAKRQRMREELASYGPPDKAFYRNYVMEEEINRHDRKYIMEEDIKRHDRKYIVEEDINRHDTRNIVLNKRNVPQEFEELYESGEEWVDEDTGALHVSRTRRIDQGTYRNAKRTYDRDNFGDSASEDWLSSQDSSVHAQRDSIRDYKPGAKYMKVHSRSGPLSWYNSNQTDKKSGVHRQHRIWKKNDDYGNHTNINDDEQPENWVNLGDAEPREGSEEFKQLVDEAFLLFSKRLNLNPAVRRRYKEQGKAGSLFCIVCGKSSSKEFMAAQNLVQHAFMSHKIGLRAQHLGLHKAICVLMGWNSSVPCDAITCAPEILPDEEAFAQKEDLMLWPPLVVIHNISMSYNNPEQQKVIPIEGVEAFLRGKGIVGGKIKVCLGKPADQSVMLVKFLGTFTGLGNAEKLHKYFEEKKHGREEFEHNTSNNSNNSNSWEEETQGGQLEEHLLYGYLGIAEDLDRLDFNTKKWILVKSKKEIQELANAPVKIDDKSLNK